MTEDNLFMNNVSEEDMGQLHALDIPANAIADIRKKLQMNGPSLSHCEECGEPIPAKRRKAVNVRTCIDCQELIEKGKL